MFDPVDPKQSFPALERGILKYWKEEDTFKRSVHLRTAREGSHPGDPLNGMAVGTVFIGLCKDGLCKTQRLRLEGDRQEIRQATVLAALRLLRDTLIQGSGPSSATASLKDSV